jgi:hypothetical protein
MLGVLDGEAYVMTLFARFFAALAPLLKRQPPGRT